MNTLSTNTTPVLYGPGYLDAEQLARQTAAVDAAPSSIYGPGYLDGPVVTPVLALDVPTQAPVVEPEPEPEQFTVKQLDTLLTQASLTKRPGIFDEALHAEAFRAAGPRKSALERLLSAANFLENTEAVDTITAMIDGGEGAEDTE